MKQLFDIMSIKTWARQLKQELYALYLAYRDPRVPWYARIVTAGVVAYAFSPFDLIPDFIPILGYLDDLLLVPLGVWLVLRMIPAEVMAECRERAREEITNKPVNWVAGALMIAVWVLLAGFSFWLIIRIFRHR
jgi:uncharacterized membrane protein YkvA (DUF1232 family)